MRNMGYRGRRGRYPGNGPFRDLPPYQRPGRLYGNRDYSGSYDPAACQRFPWLPRWWWADPQNREGIPEYPPITERPEQEKNVLEKRAEFLDREIEYIKKRLEEIKSDE